MSKGPSRKEHAENEQGLCLGPWSRTTNAQYWQTLEDSAALEAVFLLQTLGRNWWFSPRKSQVKIDGRMERSSNE